MEADSFCSSEPELKNIESKSRKTWCKDHNVRFKLNLSGIPRYRSLGARVVSWPKNPTIDIVMVHGYKCGHDGWGTDDTFWPAVLLAHDLPHARIACWEYNPEYDVKVFEWPRNGVTMEFIDKFCADLSVIGGYGLRPLTLVCHDIGCLLAEMSLLNYVELRWQRRVRGIATALDSVVFFGTPEAGWKQAQDLEAVKGRHLQRLSDKDAVRRFWHAAQELKLRHLCFIPTVGCTKDCGYLETPSFDKDADLSNLPTNAREQVIEIPKCRCAMTKFLKRTDIGYADILAFLKQRSEEPPRRPETSADTAGTGATRKENAETGPATAISSGHFARKIGLWQRLFRNTKHC